MRPASGADPAERGALEGFSGLWRVVGQVAASTSLVLALMVYFGWVRTDVLFGAFGISSSALGQTVQDYALRSVGSLPRPLAVVLLALVLLRPAHHVVSRAVRSPHRIGRMVAPALLGIGVTAVGLGLLGFSGLVVFDVEWPLVPMSLGLGLLVAAYGVTLRPAPPRRGTDPAPGRDPAPSALAVLQRVALAAILVLTLFWSAAVYAQLDGVGAAERIAQRPASLPGAVVFTPHRLHIQTTGVVETVLPPEAEPRYRYRYDGLRLLIRSEGRFFLLPVRWRPGQHAVVLNDDPEYRLEFFRGG